MLELQLNAQLELLRTAMARYVSPQKGAKCGEFVEGIYKTMRLGQTLPTLTRPFYGDVRREMLERMEMDITCAPLEQQAKLCC